MQIRKFLPEDEKPILKTYQEAFRDYPWFENLSKDTIWKRWRDNKSQTGFTCLVAESNGEIAGAIWWDEIDNKKLISERGKKLCSFVKHNFPEHFYVWERELMVDPRYQRSGIATKLRSVFIDKIKQRRLSVLILTRMREDNYATIKIARRLGFRYTGISIPLPQKQNTFHQYWYLAIEQE